MIARFDITLLTWFNQNLIPGSLPVLKFLSESATLINVAVTAVFLVLFMFGRSKARLRQFMILLLVLIISALLTLGLKYMIDRERPFYTYPYIEKRTHGGDSSFPSGHTMETFAIAMAVVILLERKEKKWAIPLFFWALVIGYSRMALGVHYPTDVLGGMVLGLLTGSLLPLLLNSRASRSSPS